MRIVKSWKWYGWLVAQCGGEIFLNFWTR
jgi:hypothetical protein